MADLIVYMPNHGFADTTHVYVSWLDDNYYVSNKTVDSFKLTTTSGGAVYVQFAGSIIDGYVREVTEAATTTITGLDHLEGEIVYALANGVILGQYTVSSGSITLLKSVFNYVVGLPYTSTLVPSKLDLDGLGLATTKKLTHAILTLNKTIGGKAGQDAQNLDNIRYRDAGDSDEEFPFFTGDVRINLPSGYERQGNIMVQQARPQPMTVLSLTIDAGAYND